MKIDKNQWIQIREYFRSFPKGSIITRKDYIKNFSNIDIGILDSYRWRLTEACFIEKIKVGKYIKIEDIPENYTTTELNKVVYWTKQLIKGII